jgi:hypothetical protein
MGLQPEKKAIFRQLALFCVVLQQRKTKRA